MKITNITVRMTALVVVAILMATACSKQKPLTESKPAVPEAKAKPPVLVEPNAGVDKIQKGMNKKQVEAAIGKPDKKKGNWWFFLHRGMTLGFGDDGVVFNIKCTSPFAGVTKEGIGIGSTRAELLAAYGSPGEEKHFQGFDDLWFAPLGINFDVENDKVTSFIVHLNAR